jgi:acetyltransferase-like isoleucine patch superfamily enzyme
MKIPIFSELRLYFCNNWINKIPSHIIRLWFYRKVMGFQIGENSSILMHCTFDAAKGFRMGSNSVINAYCKLDTRGGIDIGNNVSISSDVIILTADHDMNSPSFDGRNKPIKINDYAWIGTRVLILPGIVIGNGAVAAAGSVITKDIVDFAVVAGVPGKIIKNRSENLSYNSPYRRLFQ